MVYGVAEESEDGGSGDGKLLLGSFGMSELLAIVVVEVAVVGVVGYYSALAVGELYGELA